MLALDDEMIVDHEIDFRVENIDLTVSRTRYKYQTSKNRMTNK